MKKILVLAALALTLTACGSNNGSSSTPSTTTTAVGTSGSGMPPAYLSVPSYQSCLTSQANGSSTQWCMPAQQPAGCPDASWQQLSSQGIASC